MLKRSQLNKSNNKVLDKLLGPNLISPRYQDQSIANIPATIGKLLGVDRGYSSPALDMEILKSLGDDVERVVLLVVDGMGFNRLQKQLKNNDSGFNKILDDYGLVYSPITSVSPSTTCVATSVLLSNGATAAEMGTVGYSYVLPELALVANMLFWLPAYKPNARIGELTEWGINPEDFLPNLSMAQTLTSAKIPMRVVMPDAYKNSPLSRMQLRGAEVDGYVGDTDMWQKLANWLTETAYQKAYAYAYNPVFDTLSHRDTADGPIWDALWQELNFQLKRFIDSLTAEQRNKTVFLITADHGHVSTPLNKRIIIEDHQFLLDNSLMMPGGEPRQMYLYALNGRKDALLDYAKEELPSFLALDVQEALAAGLYGDTSKMHPDTPKRLGDVALISLDNSYLWLKSVNRKLLSKHGGLLADEMIVPFIALRFD